MRPRNRMLLVLVMAVLSACGSGSDRAATLPAVTTEPAAEAPASNTPSVEPVAPKTMSKAQARKALLSVKDMPTGYATDESDAPADQSSKVSPAGCGPLADQTIGTTLAQANFAEGGLTGGLLVQSIVVPPKGMSPTQRIKQIEALVSKCQTYKVRDTDGVYKIALSGLSFPELGDYTLAGRSTAKGPNLTISGDVIYVAVGAVYIRIATAGLAETIRGKELETVVRTAVERVQST